MTITRDATLEGLYGCNAAARTFAEALSVDLLREPAPCAHGAYGMTSCLAVGCGSLRPYLDHARWWASRDHESGPPFLLAHTYAAAQHARAELAPYAAAHGLELEVGTWYGTSTTDTEVYASEWGTPAWYGAGTVTVILRLPYSAASPLFPLDEALRAERVGATS